MNGTYGDVNGVRMWYADLGSGEPLVMLHPGGVGAMAFGPNLDALASHFHVYLPERRGYGHSPDADGPYTYELMAERHDCVSRAHRSPSRTIEALAAVQCRALVMCADDDEVRLEHAIDFYRALPAGELAVVPGTSHGLLVEKPTLCQPVLVEFLTQKPVPTLAPIRRK